ncbi:hypothetical protein A2U01_0093884, partial [Trifolium medium]|nr:hypothetical protein [Trifolium medium]
KKEAGTTSESVKEKVVAEKAGVVIEKVDVVVSKKSDAAVVEKPKKKDLKRKSSGIKIEEGRSKSKHDKARRKDESSTES